MFHQRFDTKVNGKAKRIGILGETHIYTPDESLFAEKQVAEYKNIGIESTGNSSVLRNLTYNLFFMAYLPYHLMSQMTLERANNRNISIPDADDHAKRLNKRIIPLDTEMNATKIILAAIVYSSLLIPYTIPYCLLKSKDKEKNEDREEEDHLIRGVYYHKEGVFWPWLFDLKKRDRHMAKTSVDFLRREGDEILINCGMLHVPGIRRNLEQMTNQFRLIRTDRC